MKPITLNIGTLLLLLLITLNSHAQEVKELSAWTNQPLPVNRSAFSEPVIVEEGETFEVLAYYLTGDISNYILVSAKDREPLTEPTDQWLDDDEGSYANVRLKYDTWNKYQRPNLVFYGPCMIQLQTSYGNRPRYSSFARVTYRINSPTTEDSSSSDATEAKVKVPADATGDVQVVMESSEDGKTWVLAGPGPYPAKGSKLQFRIRIVTTQ